MSINKQSSLAEFPLIERELNLNFDPQIKLLVLSATLKELVKEFQIYRVRSKILALTGSKINLKISILVSSRYSAKKIHDYLFVKYREIHYSNSIIDNPVTASDIKVNPQYGIKIGNLIRDLFQSEAD